MIVALDDFAGTGWGVACQQLGIDERGVEIMPEARATREANGMVTVGGDVWEHIRQQLAEPIEYGLYIGSPPCQTFSVAGSGAGRRALDEVLGLIDVAAFFDVDELHAFGERHDPRTALVLAPLVRIANDIPTYVVLEQVPPVLPVWERYATEMRQWGYSVWAGILQAEQYGVPQTRRRAVLIARADGIEASPPPPTHSRYHPTNPGRLDADLLPWRSMAEALGWAADDGRWVEQSAHSQQNGPNHRPVTVPAKTVTSDVGGLRYIDFAKVSDRARALYEAVASPNQSVQIDASRPNVTPAEASALQSYPAEFNWAPTLPNGKPVGKSNQFLQIGNAVPPLLARAILAHTVPVALRSISKPLN